MKIKNKNSYLWLVNLIAFIGVVVINFTAQFLLINGHTPAYVSSLHPGILTPPGFVFMIWSLIYSLIGVFIFFKIIYRDEADTNRMGIYFLISCILNISWIFAWHYERILLSQFIMIALFATLFYIYRVTRESEKAFTKVTFSVYYAWISVAFLASLFVTFGNNTYGTAEQIFAILALILIGASTLLHLYKFNDLAYSLTVLWAIGGLMYKYITSSVPHKLLVSATAIVTLTVAFAVINKVFFERKLKVGEIHA